MELHWQATLAQLRDFVANNPEISIGSSKVIIPTEVRSEFYRLFDMVETDFVKDYFPESLEKGRALSIAWSKATQKLRGLMPVKSIVIAAHVQWFLNDPLDGLIRPLTNPLFEVMKGKMDVTKFEEDGKRLVSHLFDMCFKEGYRRWVELSIVSLLSPEKTYRVPAVDEIADPLMGEGHENPGQHIADIPEAEQYDSISFQQHPIVSFVVPKILVSSTKLGRFIAMHSEFVEPYWAARELSQKAEWFNFISLKKDSNLTVMRPDQKMLADLPKILPDIALYTAEDINDISIVADHSHILRPDLGVEVLENADWFERGELATIKRHQSIMKPRTGTFVICLEPPPQAAFDELMPKPATEIQAPSSNNTKTMGIPLSAPLPEQGIASQKPEPKSDIRIIRVGYDENHLQGLLDALGSSIQVV